MSLSDTQLDPIDRQTAIAMFAPGEKFEISPKDTRVTSELPLPTRPLTKQALANSAHIPGTRFERMVVVGLSRDWLNRWVCRCDCGRYELRSAKAIRLGRGGMCYVCDSAKQGLFKHNAMQGYS